MSHTERIDAKKVRERSQSFRDHFSQARLFFNSQSGPEKNHIVDALRFELGKVKTVAFRKRCREHLTKVFPPTPIRKPMSREGTLAVGGTQHGQYHQG